MVESSWNKVVGVLVIIFALIGLIDHAEDIVQPYQAAEMTTESRQFLRRYVSSVQKQLNKKTQVSAEALLQVGGYQQSASTKAYVLSEESVLELNKTLRNAEAHLRDITTTPVEETVNWLEVPYVVISLLVIIGGFLLMGGSRYKFKVFYTGLLCAVAYDVLMLATASYSVWGMAIIVNVLFLLIVFTANRGRPSSRVEDQQPPVN